MATKTELINALKDSYAAMQKVVDIAREDDSIYPPWKIKEILAHLAGWDDAGIETIRAVSAGEVPPTPAARGADIYNAQTVSTRESLNYEQTCREWYNTRMAFIQEVEKLDESKLGEPIPLPWGSPGIVAEAVLGLAAHQIEHAEEIHKILTQKKTLN